MPSSTAVAAGPQEADELLPHLYFKADGVGAAPRRVCADGNHKYDLRFFGLQGDTITLNGEVGMVDGTGLTCHNHSKLVRILNGAGTTETTAIVVTGVPASAGAPLTPKCLQSLKEDIAIIKRHVQAKTGIRHASTITDADLDSLEAHLHITFMQGTVEKEPLDAEALASCKDTTELGWEDNKPEAGLRKEHLDRLKRQVDLPSHLRWSSPVNDITQTSQLAWGASLPFDISCRPDVMVVAGNQTRSEEGSIATVEIKKKVVQQSLREAKVTFVCASLKSHLPVISCVTDMDKVGVVFYTSGQRRPGDDSAICAQIFFRNADSMMAWLRVALSRRSVPADIMQFKRDLVVLPGELPNPKRIRMPVPVPKHAMRSQATDLRTVHRILAGFSMTEVTLLARETKRKCAVRTSSVTEHYIAPTSNVEAGGRTAAAAAWGGGESGLAGPSFGAGLSLAPAILWRLVGRCCG